MGNPARNRREVWGTEREAIRSVSVVLPKLVLRLDHRGLIERLVRGNVLQWGLHPPERGDDVSLEQDRGCLRALGG